MILGDGLGIGTGRVPIGGTDAQRERNINRKASTPTTTIGKYRCLFDI
jgi:hypothetical protein